MINQRERAREYKYANGEHKCFEREKKVCEVNWSPTRLTVDLIEGNVKMNSLLVWISDTERQVESEVHAKLL